MEQDHYKILGLNKNASLEEINKAFKKMSLKFHPDKNPETVELFKSINIAHKTLANIKLRSEYDQEYDDCDITIDSLFRLYGSDPLSKTYRKLYQSFLINQFKKEPQVFNSMIKVILFVPKIKTDPYEIKINQATSLESKWKTKIVYKPIVWKEPNVKIIESDLSVNQKLYDKIIPVNSQNLQHDKIQYPTNQLVTFEYGFTNVFDIDNNKLRYPVNPKSSFALHQIPKYSIQPLPYFILDEVRPKCSNCNVEFTFFNRRHHCRMCGEIQCSDCQTTSSIPHLGYILKTKICLICFNKLPFIDFDVWVANIPTSNAKSYLSHMISIFPNNKFEQKWIDLGDSFVGSKLELAFQCYVYAWIDKPKQKIVFNKIVHIHPHKIIFDHIVLFNFNDETSFMTWFEIEKIRPLAIACLSHFHISVKSLLDLAIKKSDYTEMAILIQIENKQMVLSDSIDYVIMNIRYGPQHYFSGNYIFPQFDTWLKCKKFSVIYQIFYEMIKQKLKFNESWTESYQYAYKLITLSVSDWVNKITLEKNEDLHIIKLLQSSSISNPVLKYRLDELTGITINWKKVAMEILSNNKSLAFSCYNFTFEDFDDLVKIIPLESLCSHFYNSHDKELTKQLIIKTFEQTKNLDIIYSGLKYFGKDNSMVKQFHKIIVQNETSIAIIQSALNFYHDEQVYNKCFGVSHQKLMNNLITIFYTYNLSEMKKITISEDQIKIADKMVAQCCTEATVLSEILKSKIVKDNSRKYLFYLQSALMLGCEPETILELEPKVSSEFYICRTLKPPTHIYQDKLRPVSLIKILKRIESEIEKMNNPFDQAMQYVDLSCAMDSGDLKVNCFLLACVYLLQVGDVASKKLISKLLVQSFAITYLHLAIFSQKHFYGIILDLLNVLDKSNMIDSHLSEILQTTIKEFKEVNQIVLFNTKLTTCLDFLYVRLVNHQYLIYKLKKIAPQNQLEQYHLFNGLYQGWITEEDADFETERLICLKNLNPYDLTTTESILNFPLMERKDGWITGKLKLSGQTFSDIDGFIINKRTGKLTLLLTGSGLFTTDDVFEILGLGITGAFVTLDQPDVMYRHHPYQKMIYGPKTARGTNFLGTMLHADYILKAFSTGIEVNSFSPFAFRKFDHGIPCLTEIDSDHSGQAHRFWIEAKDLGYNVVETDDTITVFYDKLKLGVKQHRMKYDSDGKLVDDDDAEYLNSPEAKFANEFSNNYDVIAKKYPIFARLNPLMKLSVSVRLIQNFYDYLVRKLGPDCEPILSKIKSQSHDYPTASDAEKVLDKMCRDQGLYDKSRISNLSSMRTQVRRQLDQNDIQFTEQIAESLNHIYSTNITRSQVHSWLVFGSSDIKNAIKNKIQQRTNELNKGLQGIKLESDKVPTKSTDSEPCLVPAVFVTDDHRRVYGGVNMGVNLQQSNVQYSTYTQGSKVWQVSSYSGGTYQTYTSTNPNSNTQAYYRHTNNPIHHITDHSSQKAIQTGVACVNVHYTNGSTSVYRQQSNGLYMPGGLG